MQDFKIIYDRYWALMVRYGTTFGLTVEDAKDITQMAFISLSEHLKDINSDEHAQRYLYVCVKNNAFNYLKHNKQVAKYDDVLAYLPKGEEDGPDIETELLDLIYCHMQKLPPMRRQIFKLIFLEGLKLQAVADLLHLSINTVKSQRAKALLDIRSLC